MVHQGYKVTSAKLANGETVVVNDHVYSSPPWSDRDGTPYTVCRIIEFLPPNATPKKGSSQRTNNELQVRLSLFYRPSDISGRNVSDFRLLLAAIHTDIQPLSNIRGRCHVRHKDRIDDLIKWKRLPDHFYFVRFFDPYIKREFEVIRAEAVNNIPSHVRDVLTSRYEYVVTEREMVADLTDAFRSCCVCEEWASSQESVQCEACKKHYHMKCLNPPLLAKPAKGYSWVCLPCLVQRRKDVEEQKFHYVPNGSAPAKPKNGKAKEKVVDPGRPDRTYRGWPWRYFGLYTRAEDTLDPDDPIFPRAATRVGLKFQANVLSWEEQQEAEARRRSGENEAGPSRHIAVERGHDVGERKHESTLDVLSVPSDHLNAYMEQVAALTLPVPPYDVVRVDKAIKCYTKYGRDKALAMMRALKLSDFDPITFDDHETLIFEEDLEKHGGLDTHETAKALGNKRPAEVLRFSYIWKNKKLKLENEALRQHHRVATSHARQNKTLGAPSLGRMRKGDSSDDAVSLYGSEITGTKKAVCAACSTRISNVWWRCPRTIHGDAMCENCGSNYRKYGVISFTKAEDSKKPDKKEVKKVKGETSGASTPVPVVPKLPPCAFCRKMEPKAAMARCKTCTFSVHAGCYGIASQDMGPEWECELCTSARLEENYLNPHCVLCPKDINSIIAKTRKRPAADFDLLSCLKPTEGRQWAHLLCSAWSPEIRYTDTSTFRTIEGVATVARDRWEQLCTICEKPGGAVVGCAECGVRYHASCAWSAGYKFGFEFSLAKPGKREVVTIARFREETGVMNPGVWCKGHDLEGRVIYDMHDIDPEQNETALQIYTASYKALPPDESFALLRKAVKLDQYLPPIEHKVKLKVCAGCGVDVSPMWYRLPAEEVIKEERMDANRGGEVMMCHLCWFRR